MKRIVINAVSAALAASFLFSVASCSKPKTGKEAKKISADSPWFENKTVKVDQGLDETKKLSYTVHSPAGSDDKYIVFYNEGSYDYSEHVMETNFDFSEYYIHSIIVIDKTTYETVRIIDLNESVQGSVEDVFYSNGIITVRDVFLNDSRTKSKRSETYFDPATGAKTGSREIDNDEGAFSYIAKHYLLGEYTADGTIVFNGEENRTIRISIFSPSGDRKNIEIMDQEIDFTELVNILPTGSNTALVCTDTGEEYKYYNLDLTGCSAEPADENEYEWLSDGVIRSAVIGNDGNIYSVNGTSVLKLDMEGKTAEDVFNFSWCGMNLKIFDYLSFDDCTDDTVIFSGAPVEYKRFTSDLEVPDLSLYIFTKAERNPHEGKTVLELYSADEYIDECLGNAINTFNETNGKCFIEVTDRYNFDTDYSGQDSDDDYESDMLDLSYKISNALAMDLMNGTGPDILINTSNLGQLNNTDYLTDLSPYVKKLDPSGYFTNVVDAARTDGKLFQLPVCFRINGIRTDPAYAGQSGKGFTVDEYKRFLKDTLNGEDIIPYGQSHYFVKLFNAMSDKFISDGKIDLTGPDFAGLAGFVNDNVVENASSWSEHMAPEFHEGMEPGGFVAPPEMEAIYGVRLFKLGGRDYEEASADYISLDGTGEYFADILLDPDLTAILGIPSTDGRGPLLESAVSVAVSAQASDTGACGEFVQLLLSEEVQMKYAMRDNFVLSRNVFKESAHIAMEYYNTASDTGIEKSRNAVITEQDIANLENIILDCSLMNYADPSIDIILLEEMQAYFAGQKDLDSVIVIAQDRAQKVLDERD